MADRFYVNCPLATQVVTLRDAEAHHLATVCRLRAGDRVCLFNGDGHEYPAQVLTVGKREVSLQVLAVESPRRELPYRVEVAAPLPKGNRGQFLVEKLTEFGVTCFVPLQTKRSVVHPRESRLERLERYVIEASKQCGRNTLMEVHPLIAWEMYCQREELPALREVAHPGSGQEAAPAGQDVALAVGPEGGFTEEEIFLACGHRWTTVGLGPRILRVETAALALVARSTASAGSSGGLDSPGAQRWGP
jgi:16S rRNA (uracil1498-N3)-methyltransferase